jgi:hypothetical protein
MSGGRNTDLSGVFPFAESGRTGGARTLSRETVHTSRGVELTGALCAGQPASHWFLTAPPQKLFPTFALGLFRPTVPRPLRIGFILLCLISPSEFLRRSSRSLPFGSTTSARVSSLFATSTDGVHLARKLPLPLCSVLRFSQPLDGLRHHRLCRLISSRSHVQGYSVQGFLPSRSRVNSSSTACPRAVTTHPLTDVAIGCHG